MLGKRGSGAIQLSRGLENVEKWRADRVGKTDDLLHFLIRDET